MRSAANAASVPSSASTLIAGARSAAASSPCRSVVASTSMPSIPSVPLIRARHSFSASATGAIPAARSASPAGFTTPAASRTVPSPVSASATAASGARSPEQPSEPYSGTTGVIPALSRPTNATAVAGRPPVRPVANVRSRNRAIARTTSRSTSGPAPAACDRTSDCCSTARFDSGMYRVASDPKPVEIP
jgi:hypothetical protein